MTEVTSDSFWDTDLSELPGAIEINDETKIVDSIGGIPVSEYTQGDVNSVNNIIEK